jgi:hypothetical protein
VAAKHLAQTRTTGPTADSDEPTLNTTGGN